MIRLEYTGKKSRETILDNVVDVDYTVLKDYGSSNLLLFGDNLQGLYYLLSNLQYKECVDLIYIDVPYNTGNTFHIGGTISNTTNKIAYKDKYNNLEEYLEFLRERLILLYELLSPQGSLYIHCSTEYSHYIKIITDEIFTQEMFRNDITRRKTNSKNFKQRKYGNIKDTILYYTKTNNYIWNNPREPYTKEDIEKLYPYLDETGERYTTESLSAPGVVQNGETGEEWKGRLPPSGRHWCTSPKTLTEWDNKGLIQWSTTGNPRKKVYANERISKGKLMQDIIDYRDPPKPYYPTTKNEELLRKIILASTNKNSFVIDIFMGSGTTMKMARETGRKYIGMDNSKESMELAIREFHWDTLIKLSE